MLINIQTIAWDEVGGGSGRGRYAELPNLAQLSATR
jgi:hypothetical protein